MSPFHHIVPRRVFVRVCAVLCVCGWVRFPEGGHSVDGLSATVTGLVEESGIVRGVRFRDQDNKSYEVYSKLTVVCDGSGSVLRKKVSDGLCFSNADFIR